MTRRGILAALAVFLLAPATAGAGGGSYVFDGGTAVEQAQVRGALDASSFDWSLVPAQITIHIAAGTDSYAQPGDVWLDANLLDSGRFSWGTVQHEYGHQVDFFLLTDFARIEFMRVFGVENWCNGTVTAHRGLGCERFASTLAWSYWQSRSNALRPTSRLDEAGLPAPALFRSLLTRFLGGLPRATGARSPSG